MPGSPYADLERPPLVEAALRRAVVSHLALWTDLRVLDEVTSTNAVAAEAVAAGAGEGLVVVAEHQSGGRGRLDRAWESPPRAGLTFSAYLVPSAVPGESWPMLGLLAGLAAAEALQATAGVDVALKWPNDLEVGGCKVGGLLAERVREGVVIGIGINVTTRQDELPTAQATSLRLSGAAVTDRDTVLRAVLRRLAERYDAWCLAAGSSAELIADYRRRCATLGREVEVLFPGGQRLRGTAEDVDGAGRLVVRTGDGTPHAVAVGDVIHLRATI